MLAQRDCQHCLKYEYDLETDELVTSDETGEPLPRLSEAWAPCRLYAAGKVKEPCPKGTPERPNTLSRENQQFWRFYEACKAVGRFPKEGIVLENAATISAIIERHRDRQRAQQQLADDAVRLFQRERPTRTTAQEHPGGA